MSTTVPDDLALTMTYLGSEPFGEGMVFSRDGEIRLVVYASATALEEVLGDEPTSSDLYPFEQLVGLLPDALPWMGLEDGCDQVLVRPYAGGTFFGSTRTFDCDGGRALVRVMAVSGARDVSVVAEASADGYAEAQRVATTAVTDLAVDVGELPTEVPSAMVILTE